MHLIEHSLSLIVSLSKYNDGTIQISFNTRNVILNTKLSVYILNNKSLLLTSWVLCVTGWRSETAEWVSKVRKIGNLQIVNIAIISQQMSCWAPMSAPPSPCAVSSFSGAASCFPTRAVNESSRSFTVLARAFLLMHRLLNTESRHDIGTLN